MPSYSIEGICNEALDVIGYKRHINQIYEGTLAARVALNAWGQTRDGLLLATRPMWSHKDATLTLLKTAPVGGYTGSWTTSSPQIPWQYEYQWPTDCIWPLQIKETPRFLPVWKPQYKRHRMVFDTQSANRTILSDAQNAILVYVSQVLDPNDWHSDFHELMVQALAKKFEASFAARQPQPQGKQQNADTTNTAG